MTDSAISVLRQKYNKESKEIDEKLLKVPLKSVNEPFVYLPDLARKLKIKVVFDQKEKPSAYLRESVAEAWVAAAKNFNKKGLILRVESAYRSLESQKKRFLWRVSSMKKRYPKKSQKELQDLANVYTAGIPILSGHTAGAAVDVTLLDAKNKPVNFGVPYRHGDIQSSTDYPYLPKELVKNRKLLKKVMEKHGFVNYPFEYWHFSMGDVYAVYFIGDKYAKFSPVEYDFKKKKMFPLKSQELRKFFK
ncbi:D-alanyl-D-alanine carboxypeptidase family protein [Candidatus Woesebacteria bacterium]|nr:D-alanyl-D-alanine carboxypeptidase family protein [Candidatus Woesebacteria bacterium]